MEALLIYFLSFKQYKKSKLAISILIFVNLITTYNSFSTEIKVISIPYLSLYSEYPEKRSLSEQYVYGSAFKIYYYYSNIYLGEDMQKQGFILATASSVTTAPCSPLCKSCGKHICPPYDIKSQNIIISCSDPKCDMVYSYCDNNEKKNNCSFSISYKEGSTLKGVYINELVRFGKNYKEQNGTYVPIGCTTYENKYFLKQEANGIMGLGNTEKNFVEILYKLGAIKRNIFSLCFAQLGGIFTIGEINNKTHLEQMVFLPMKKIRNNLFGLDVKSILVNNKKLESYSENSSYNKFYIDSGTTLSYLGDKIFHEILNLTKEECQKFNKTKACGKYKYDSTFGPCFFFDNVKDLNYAIKNYWPTLHFILDGYDYKWTPERYAFNITTERQVGACMGFYPNDGSRSQLGSTWIIGHDIVFDRENNLLGFAEADCTENKEINMANGLELNRDQKEKFEEKKKEAIKEKNTEKINETIEEKIEETIEEENREKIVKNFGAKIEEKIGKKIEIKKNISIAVIIIAIFLIIFFIIFILVIIFKNNKVSLEKQLESKIKENIKISKSKPNKKDSNYVKVADESLNGSKNQISINSL
jgi:hypothetical protein